MLHVSNHQTVSTIFYLERKHKYSYIHRVIQIILSIFKMLQSKFISIPALGNKLIMLIEQNIRICPCNKELLTNTKITLSWFANKFLWFHSYIPIDKIIDIFFFQFSYILRQFSVLFTRFIRTFMVIVTFCKSIFTSNIVIFISSYINRCFVNKALGKTVTIHRTVCFSTTIAIFYNFRIIFPVDIICAK